MEYNTDTNENSIDPGGGRTDGFSTIHATDAPEHLTNEVADLVIFNDPKDDDEAGKFLDELLEKAKENGLNLVGYLFNDMAMLDDREINYSEKICSISVQKWFFVTDNFLKNKTMQFHKDEQLMNAIMKGSTFIPVWNKPKSQFKDLPYGLRAYTGLQSNDPRIVRKLKMLFNKDEHKTEKQRLQEKQKRELDAWREGELKRKMKEEEGRKRKWKAREDDMEEEVQLAVQAEHLNSIQHQKIVMEQLLKKISEDLMTEEANAGIPDYLTEGLREAQTRTHARSARTRNNDNGRNASIINMTLNQPQNVWINQKQHQ